MNRFSIHWPSLLLAVPLFLLVGMRGDVIGKQQAGDEIVFRWAFGAMVGPANDRRLVAITRDTVLKTGDRLKMLLQLKSQCFVYLFYRTAEDEIHLLFPYSLDLFESDYQTDVKYYIPRGEAWFELDDNIGPETFYLLASAGRLRRLEELYRMYHSGTEEERKEIAEKFFAEIRSLKNRHRILASPAERPIHIGGTLRGGIEGRHTSFPDIDPIASEVSSSGFYSKTFTIEHP